MGNKLKSKLSRTNSVKNLSVIPLAKYTYCALINADKKHEYHDVMIKNYLRTAAERFHHSPYVRLIFFFINKCKEKEITINCYFIILAIQFT